MSAVPRASESVPTALNRHHGGAQPGHHVSEQIRPQFLLLVILRRRKETFLQAQGEFDQEVPAEERGDPERAVRHEPAADRRVRDARARAARARGERGAPADLHHGAHARAARVDDLLYDPEGARAQPGAGERRARGHELDPR